MKFSDLGDKGPDFIREMDSQGYRGSRDDYKPSKGKEGTGKPLTAKQMMDRAHKTMMKSMSDAEKVDKGWRNPNKDVAEGNVDEASLAQMRDYFDQTDSDSVKVDRNYDAPSKKQNPVGVPPEIQALVNKMYHAGKISPQEFEVLRKFQLQTKINVGIREADKNPYAIGMAQAMKSTGDKPPLKKSTINKAHKIARAIEKGE
jgi:hypothetical protein